MHEFIKKRSRNKRLLVGTNLLQWFNLFVYSMLRVLNAQILKEVKQINKLLTFLGQSRIYRFIHLFFVG